MHLNFLLNSILLFLVPFILIGQVGITGTVIDGDFNEPLPFANILLKETGEGVTSDFDGQYAFELEQGTYTLQFSFVGYETKIITEIQVMGNEYTITDVVLNSLAQGLEEVVETVEATRNSDASVLEIQRKSASLLDGISAQTFRKIGASDIAAAVKSAKAGSVEYRNDKAGIIHAGIGKVSFSKEDLNANIIEFVKAVKKDKPSAAKGVFIKKVSLSSTMGAGVRIDIGVFN